MEREHEELSEELKLSNKRLKDMQQLLAADSSNEGSLDYSDSEVDDEAYVFLVHF